MPFWPNVPHWFSCSLAVPVCFGPVLASPVAVTSSKTRPAETDQWNQTSRTSGTGPVELDQYNQTSAAESENWTLSAGLVVPVW